MKEVVFVAGMIGCFILMVGLILGMAQTDQPHQAAFTEGEDSLTQSGPFLFTNEQGTVC